MGCFHLHLKECSTSGKGAVPDGTPAAEQGHLVHPAWLEGSEVCSAPALGFSTNMPLKNRKAVTLLCFGVAANLLKANPVGKLPQ